MGFLGDGLKSLSQFNGHWSRQVVGCGPHFALVGPMGNVHNQNFMLDPFFSFGP